MNPTWQAQAGHLLCSWSETGQGIAYNPAWMKQASDIPSGYLHPLPDLASHSPFGGAFWFQPDTAWFQSE